MKGLYLLLFLLLTATQSCNNTLNVNAEFEEVMYVYGLLEINEPTQYIRIQKNYLDPKTSALTLAKDPSQTYYPVEDLLVEMGPTGSDQFFTLNADTLLKDPGVFNNTSNLIYKTSQALLENTDYEIKITHLPTGKIVTASTEVVQNFTFQIPPEGTSPYSLNFVGEDELGNEKELEFLITSAIKAKVYDVIFRFNYYEIHTDGSIDTLYSDITIAKQYTVSNPDNSNAVSIKYIGQNVLRSFASKLKVDDNITRKLAPLPGEFIIYCGGEAMWDYYRVNVLSQTGITAIEVQPEFTNISNGLGILSSRLIKNRPNLRFNAETINFIACDQTFSGRNFQFPEVPSCE